jgi:hypothetical protein
MNAEKRLEEEHHIFLTLTLDAGEWSVSCPGPLLLREGPQKTMK